MTAPLDFIVTTAGLAAATMAYDAGIKVTLSTFALGSGYGYIPSVDMTQLQGSVLFSDTITSYTNMPDGSLMLECTVNDQAGTFSFGEVGIYTSDGILFAVSAFPTMQTKYSSLGTSVTSTYTFNAWLRLAQATAVFNVISYSEPNQLYGPWTAVIPPALMSTSAVNFIVTDLDNRNQITELIQKSVGGVLKWSIQGNQFRLPSSPVITAVDAGYNWIEISQASWAGLVPDTVAYAANYTLVVESASNYFRAVTSVSVVGSNVRFIFTAPWTSTLIAVGQTISVYCNDSALLLRNVLSTEVTRAQTAENAITRQIPGSATSVHGHLGSDSLTLTLTAAEIVMVSGVGGFTYKVSGFNKTVSVSHIGFGGMDTGSTPSSGFLAIYAIYNPTTGVSGLLAQNVTSSLASSIYSGGYLPPGFTASWLISIWATTAAGWFKPMHQWDRWLHYYESSGLGVKLFDVHNDVYVGVGGSVYCYWALPKNAIKASGMAWLSSSDGGYTSYGFHISNGGRQQVYTGYASYMAGPWNDLDVVNFCQTFSYGVGTGSHPVDVSYHLSAYEFAGT